MRKLLTILLLIPMLARAGKPTEVNRYWDYDSRGFVLHWVTAERIDSNAVRYREFTFIYEYTPERQTRFWTNYTWSTSNGNVLINNTNYPSITGGDTVFINPKSGDYRSFVSNSIHCGFTNPVDGQYIVIDWTPGAQIGASSSHIFANGFHGIDGVKIVGFTMNDHVDNAFQYYSSGDYSSYVWFDHFSIRGTNGFFPYGGLTLSTANYGGDTTHMFRHIKFTYGVLDSCWGSQSGLCALWLGGANTGAFNNNNMWRDVEIAYCYFGHYSSAANPSMYLNLSTVFEAYVHDNTFDQLGMDVFDPNGHTQCIMTISSLVWIVNNKFMSDNFGNEWRNKGCGILYNIASEQGNGGISIFAGNLIYHKRKYPVLETYKNPEDTADIAYYLPRRSPVMYNNTFVSMQVGSSAYDGADPWYSSVMEIFTHSMGDTITIRNCIRTKTVDTPWTNSFNVFFTEQHAGAAAVRDTGNNHDVEFAKNSGLADSTTYFYPLKTGWLYNSGSPIPDYVLAKMSRDIYGSKRPYSGRSGIAVDIGAVQFPAGDQLNRCWGCKIKFK